MRPVSILKVSSIDAHCSGDLQFGTKRILGKEGRHYGHRNCKVVQ